MYYSPTKLERLYRRLGTRNRCPIKEAYKLASSTLPWSCVGCEQHMKSISKYPTFELFNPSQRYPTFGGNS